MMLRVWCACVLVLGLRGDARAQVPLRAERFEVPAAALQDGASTTRLVAGGVLAGAAGWIGFGLLGAVIADDPNNYDDLEALAGFVVGSTIGESIMLPVGVHLANRRAGKVLAAMLASLGIGVAGVGLAIATQDAAPLPVIILGLTPVAQLASSIHIERATARARR